MTQGALNTPTGSGLAVRTGINDAIMRVATKGAGTARPADIATWESWLETDNPGGGIGTLWIWDGTTDIFAGFVNSTAHTFTPSSVTTTQGDLIKRGASADARFAVGSAWNKLGVNAAGDDLEWQRSGWERIAADALPVAAASVDFTSIPSNAKALLLTFALLPATNAVALQMQFSEGAAFDTGANYSWSVLYAGGGDTGTGETSIEIAVDTINSANGHVCGSILIPNPQDAAYQRAIFDANFDSGSFSDWRYAGIGVRRNAGPIDGVRLQFSSGNIASGLVSLQALRT